MKTINLGNGRELVIVDSLRSLFPSVDSRNAGYYQTSNFCTYKKSNYRFYVELKDERYTDRAVNHVKGIIIAYDKYLKMDDTWINNLAIRDGWEYEDSIYHYSYADCDEDCDQCESCHSCDD